MTIIDSKMGWKLIKFPRLNGYLIKYPGSRPSTFLLTVAICFLWCFLAYIQNMIIISAIGLVVTLPSVLYLCHSLIYFDVKKQAAGVIIVGRSILFKNILIKYEILDGFYYAFLINKKTQSNVLIWKAKSIEELKYFRESLHRISNKIEFLLDENQII